MPNNDIYVTPEQIAALRTVAGIFDEHPQGVYLTQHSEDRDMLTVSAATGYERTYPIARIDIVRPAENTELIKPELITWDQPTTATNTEE